MITRLLLPLLLLITLPLLWDIRQRRQHRRLFLLGTALTALLLVATAAMAVAPDFAPHNMALLEAYLLLIALVAIPRALWCVSDAIGVVFFRLTGSWRYGYHLFALGLLLVVWYVAITGSFFGFYRFQVRHVQFASADLPAAFDGYRIVQFSDAHVGTLIGKRHWMLRRAVDSINAQRPDLIVFTGDLQNMEPREIEPARATLSKLSAPDGVMSVLGNHDYACYVSADDATKAANCRRTQQLERSMGWTLLTNDHRTIRRGHDSLVVAGMENWGKAERMPRLGDVGKALQGTDPSAFVVMLQHDPTCWREKILPESTAQLTLSGHTHGGQFALMGHSPAALAYTEWGGMTYEGPRAINVSTGLGGLIPFRFGQPAEIVVITLRTKP